MRLTLRTLLSYLDDMLEPGEAKLIGEKVAESDIAPDLIGRIAKVTRRRGLAAPAASGDEDDASTDPNTVAEYLDNSLPAEQVGEFEEGVLNSDARLAEVAACHQILTLVLGEPAKVPPTARQRMYRLIKGKESIPYRKTASYGSVAGIEYPHFSQDEKAEADENLLLEIAGSRMTRPFWAALGILAVLAAVIYVAIPNSRPPVTQGYVSVGLNYPEPEIKAKTPDVAKIETKPFELLPEPRIYVKDDKEVIDDKNVKKDLEGKKENTVVKKDRTIITPPNRPNPERRAIGRLESKDFLLLQRKPGATEWERAIPNNDLFTADHLLSLPGNRNEIRLENGVHLFLWGSMPEYHQTNLIDLMESRVVLHVPPPGIDADLTLESGRVFITRPVPRGDKFEPARIRVRFKDELWEVKLLDPETEVCVDLIGYYGEGVPFSKQPGGPSPTTEVYLGVLAGRAGLALKFKEYPLLQAPTRVDWESTLQEKVEPKKILDIKDMEWWSKKIKDDIYSRELQTAVNSYVKRFSKPDDAQLEVAFYSAAQDPEELPGRRLFALRALQALDAYDFLPTALSDEIYQIRRTAIRCIQHWTGLSPERDLLIYKILVDKKGYTEAQAQYVMQLLHPFGEADYARPEIIAALFEAMNHEKLAVRELAYKHMEYCDPNGAREVGFFNAAAPEKNRDAVLQKWKASWKRRFIDKQ